ncbi:MAG TPA: class I SAM-dependent methyltransferase [Xanthobacteraceae bacterium]|jgi:hypothetical protein|nr:class I SAM-dependent methyltransferase [Xanthobacteraceae bacterium]
MSLQNLKRFLSGHSRLEMGAVDAAPPVFDQYEDRAPAAQNAIDVVEGWLGSFPPDIPAVAGQLAFYSDPRIAWCLAQFGPLIGRSVLELGPLEGGHTYMLEQAGAKSIDAVEANKLAYLRCLIFKEIAGLTVARFHLGDFRKWLDGGRRYDLIVASGVLYHMHAPLLLLEGIARAADALFLWTHCVTDATLTAGNSNYSIFSADEGVSFRGLPIRLYRSSYRYANNEVAFCGGMNDEHRWLHRDDLLKVLTALGFVNCQIAFEEPDHVNGPAFAIFARKPAVSPV